MRLIVGLGNPGHEFELTRHNAGFQVLDALGTVSGGEWKAAKNLLSATIKGRIHNHDVLLAKPLTYMNLSGRAVQAILSWYKLSLADVVVVHDDVSINHGRLRIQSGGGAGGQHGIESIIAEMGGKKEFVRVKFGVGPDPGGANRANYVLGRFPECDRELNQKCVDTARDAIIELLDGGLTKAMNKYNGLVIGIPCRLQTEVPPKPSVQTNITAPTEQ
ncbi:MAG TPA: aminoacyl-tRNA hydrolase [Oculatellaceae cyanobacterium]